MTAAQLLAWIVSALLLQLALGAALALGRRRARPAAAPFPAMPATPLDAQPLPAFKPGQFLTFVLPLPDPGQPLPVRVEKKATTSFHQQLIEEDCKACHRAPGDALHRKIEAGNCKQCHGQERWKPASFEHAKLFVLDRDHDSACVTCHLGHDYSRYGCYGCHEHSEAKVRAEHEEEGIRDFENCVECHRDPGVEPDERGAGRRGRD